MGDDPQDHYGVSTRTGNGMWDQVVAMSQQLINDGFKNLYEVSPDLKKVYGMEADKGKIDATFLAPEIIIPGYDMQNLKNNVIFRLKFAGGTLKNNNGTVLIPSLKDWIIAFKVDFEKAEGSIKQLKEDIARTTKELKAEEDDDEKERIQNRMDKFQQNLDYIMNTYEVPGDYSIQRLFLKLSSANWSSMDAYGDLSQAGINPKTQKPFKIQDWMIDNQNAPKNNNPVKLMSAWLKAWGEDIENSGQSVLGTSFQLPEQSKSDSTLTPTWLSHQSYGYKSEADGYPNGVTGPDGTANRNVLLYCEMVDGNKQPNDPYVSWSGNFATKPSSLSAKDGIDGCFVLSRKVFLGEFVLKHFEELNQSSEVLHGNPYSKPDPENEYNLSSYMPYDVGYDKVHNLRGDPWYKFRSSNPDNEAGKETKYFWDRENIQPNPTSGWDGITKSGNEKSNLKQFCKDNMRTEVTWKPGTGTIRIEGTTTTERDARWDQGLAEPNFADINLTAQAWQIYTIKWWMTVTIVPGSDAKGNSILTAKIEKGDESDAHVTVTPVRETFKNLKAGSFAPKMQEALRKEIKKVMEPVCKNITDAVNRAGKFIYPGRGTLLFKDSAFNKWGDLIATISHQPLAEGVKLKIPGPFSLEDSPEPIQSTIIPKPAILVPPTYKLSWDPVATENLYEGQPGKIIFKAENTTQEVINLAGIEISFDTLHEGRHVFANDVFQVYEPPKPKPTIIAPTPKEVSGTGTTGPSKTEDTKPEDAKSEDAKSEDAKPEDAKPEDAKPEDAKSGESVSEAAQDHGLEAGAAETSAAEQFAETIASGTSTTALEHTAGPRGTTNTPSGTDTDTKSDGGSGWSVLNPFKKKKQPPAPAPKDPEPVKDVGNVLFEQNAGATPVQFVVRNPDLAAQHVTGDRTVEGNEWHVVLQQNEGWIKVKPGDWFKITLSGKAGMTSSYRVMVDEIWCNDKGKTTGHLIQAIPVKVTDN